MTKIPKMTAMSEEELDAWINHLLDEQSSGLLEED